MTCLSVALEEIKTLRKQLNEQPSEPNPGMTSPNSVTSPNQNENPILQKETESSDLARTLIEHRNELMKRLGSTVPLLENVPHFGGVGFGARISSSDATDEKGGFTTGNEGYASVSSAHGLAATSLPGNVSSISSVVSASYNTTLSTQI